jgi:aspartate-semialdehyde dehydrogenase
MSPAVPLVIPEINGDELSKETRLVANPNCTTAVVLMAVAPLHSEFGLRTMSVASYQAASGAGARGLAELEAAFARPSSQELMAPRVFRAPLAFNVIPQIGELTGAGDTEEELKLERESRKILRNHELRVTATCVRVPVRRAHAAAVFASFDRPLSLPRIEAILDAAPGLKRVELPTPLEASNRDDVLVGRLRTRDDEPRELSLFVCGDQILKGAALNAIQIAERLLPWALNRP